MVKNTYSTLTLGKRLMPFTVPYRRQYALAVLFILVSCALSVVPPLLIKMIIDRALPEHRTELVTVLSLLFAGVVVVSSIARLGMEYVHERISVRFIADLREVIFRHTMSQSMEFFDHSKSGSLLGVIRTDTVAVYGVLVNCFLASLGEVVQIVGVAVALFWMNPLLALVAFGVAPLLVATLMAFNGPLRRRALAVRDKDVAMLEFFQEALSNMQLVKTHHQEQWETERHQRISEDVNAAILRNVRCKFVSVFLMGNVISIASVAVLWYGGHKVLLGTLSVGSLVAFFLYVTKLYTPIQSLANRTTTIYSGLASVERIVETLDRMPKLVEGSQVLSRDQVRGVVTFEKVSFQYSAHKKQTLSGITFEILPGEIIGLVGPSGAGKTTVGRLLLRLYDVHAGGVAIDGHDVRTLNFASLYNSVGVISQETYLYNTTIEENIRYGSPLSTSEQVRDAARSACLDTFIESLPHGYQTVIGPRGAQLSGGQRQRLAVARLILRDAPIWILDEFTSSLDPALEANLLETVRPLLVKRAVLLISHRLSTIRMADRIVVMQNGRLVGKGTHAFLEGSCPLYRSLMKEQETSRGLTTEQQAVIA